MIHNNVRVYELVKKKRDTVRKISDAFGKFSLQHLIFLFFSETRHANHMQNFFRLTFDDTK